MRSFIVVSFIIFGITFDSAAYAQATHTGGSCSGTECIVTGTKSGGGAVSGTSPIQFGPPPSPGPGSTTAPEDTFLTPETFCPLTLESSEDAMARAIAQAISGMNPNIEHGAMLVRLPDNSLLAMEIISGGNGWISGQMLVDSVEDAGYYISQTVGYVHYHNPGTAAENLRNRAPSWDGASSYSNASPGNGDYAFMASLTRIAVNQHGANANAFNAQFTSYVIDSNGDVFQWNGATPHSAVSDQNISEIEAENAQKDASSKC